jgi:hypothetical protein
LWFDGQAEEAANFYAGLLPDSRVDRVVRSPADYSNGKVGDVLVVEFTVAGRGFSGLNGGPYSRFPKRYLSSSHATTRLRWTGFEQLCRARRNRSNADGARTNTAFRGRSSPRCCTKC